MGISVLDNILVSAFDRSARKLEARKKLQEIIRFIEQLDGIEDFVSFKRLLLSQLYYLREVM